MITDAPTRETREFKTYMGLINRTPVTDAKRIIMMRHKDKFPWSRIAGEMNLSVAQCKRRYQMYCDIMQRMNAMTMHEISIFIKNHPTFHQRYLGETDGVHDTTGRGGRKSRRA